MLQQCPKIRAGDCRATVKKTSQQSAGKREHRRRAKLVSAETTGSGRSSKGEGRGSRDIGEGTASVLPFPPPSSLFPDPSRLPRPCCLLTHRRTRLDFRLWIDEKTSQLATETSQQGRAGQQGTGTGGRGHRQFPLPYSLSPGPSRFPNPCCLLTHRTNWVNFLLGIYKKRCPGGRPGHRGFG